MEKKMKKRSKALPVLISISVSILGYLIFYSVYQISMLVLGVFPIAINNEFMAGTVLKWGILLVEGICMLILIYHFHKETKGMTIGYVEVCLLLWLCGILGFTAISKQKNQVAIVLIIDLFLGIIKDVRLVTAFLIVFALASVVYKIVPKWKRTGEVGVKKTPNAKKQKMISILLAVPASLLAYGIYRLVHSVVLVVIVQLFIAPNFWEMDNVFFDILIEIVSGCWFVALLRRFHQKTRGMLIGYMEAGFLLWMPLLWNGLYENRKWIHTFNVAEIKKWLLPIFLFIMIGVSSYCKRKKNEIPKERNMGLPFFLVIFSYGIYYVVILCISIANFSDFDLALISACGIFSVYFFVIHRLSKGKISKQLLMAYAVFLSGLLFLCGIYIAQEWNIGSLVLNQKDYLEELIKDMVPNLEMYFAYGFSIVAGGILAQGWQWLHGEATPKEK